MSILMRSLLAAAVVMLAGCGGGSAKRAGAESEQFSQDPPPSLTFSAQPSSIAAGGSTTLQWSSDNSDSCVASGAWSGSKATAGSEVMAGLRSSQTYALSCSGPGGSTLREIQVLVDAANQIVISFQASDTQVRAGTQVELQWSTQNAQDCEASGAWSGSQGLSGTFTTPGLDSNATFRLTCSAGGTSAIAIVTVQVSDNTLRWSAPLENVDGTALTDLVAFNLYWGATSRNYTSSVRLGAGTTEYLAELSPGSYYFAVTALNARGEESDYSNEVLKQIF